MRCEEPLHGVSSEHVIIKIGFTVPIILLIPGLCLRLLCLNFIVKICCSSLLQNFKQQWFGFIQVLMNILSTRGALERGVCLDALVSIMLDSSSNQMVWCC